MTISDAMMFERPGDKRLGQGGRTMTVEVDGVVDSYERCPTGWRLYQSAVYYHRLKRPFMLQIGDWSAEVVAHPDGTYRVGEESFDRVSLAVKRVWELADVRRLSPGARLRGKYQPLS